MSVAHFTDGCTCTRDGESPECPHHGYEAVIARLNPAVQALADLVELKDGPRDATYEAKKPMAWEAARAALRRCGYA